MKRQKSFLSKWSQGLWGLLILVLLLPGTVSAQSISAQPNVAQPLPSAENKTSSTSTQQVDVLKSYKTNNSFLSPMKTAPMPFTGLAATWYEEQPEGTKADLYVRFLAVDGWSSWHLLESDIDHQEGETKDPNNPTAFIATNRAVAYQYKVELATNNTKITPVIKNIEFTYINAKGKAVDEKGKEQDVNSSHSWLSSSLAANNTGTSANTGTSIKTNATQSSKAGLQIISRAEWGADETLRLYNPDKDKDEEDDGDEEEPNMTKEYLSQLSRRILADSSGHPYTWPLEYSKTIDRIVIHHTATTSNLADPKQAIRNIYYYHTITRKWGDIGYNYIIDQQGNIYEGRYGGEGVVGAHAAGANIGSIGIAVLGNYQDTNVPEPVLRSLALLIKEKAEKYGIDPEGKSTVKGEKLPNIIGHRDVGTTSCPGEKLYAQVPMIRKLVKGGLKAYVIDKRTVTKKVQDYNYDLNKSLDPIVFKEDSTEPTKLTVELKNTGRKSWNAQTYLKLYTNQDFIPGREIKSQNIGKTVAKGQTARFTISLKPEDIKDKSFLELILVFDGKTAVEKYIVIPVLAETKELASEYDYKVVGIEIPERLVKGQVVEAVVKVKNTGTKTWKNRGKERVTLGTNNPFNRVSRLLVRPGARMATLTEAQVKPGSIGTFVVKIKAPQVDGYYREDFVPVLGDQMPFTSQNTYIDFVVGKGKKPSNTDNNINKSPSEQKRDTPAENPDLIRIGLSFSGDPLIGANGKFSLWDNNKKIATFAKDEQFKVTYSDNKFQVQSTKDSTKKFSFTKAPRFTPESGAIMRIDNYENRPAWKPELNDNQYRGSLEVHWYDNSLKVVNELPIEDYLKGLAEISAQDPYEKIKAVITLARSYATYYVTVGEKFPGAPFHLSDDPERSQKYLGYNFEVRNITGSKAVKDTQEMVVKYKNAVIKTPYFSSSDGKTRSAYEVWGWKDTPYLKSVDDPGCKGEKLNGHGVGLSGCGARYWAQQGKNYKEIIQYYFQGVTIEKR